MNIKLLCKKTYKSLLALMIMFSMFPQFTETVVAEETTLPVEQFATKEQLKTFNTNDNDGEAKSAKVYFGNNNQQWWIAGSQDENSITLFVASPLASDQAFEQNYNQVKPYRADWNCDYTSTGGSNPSDVYPNHYGASPLRSTLKNLEKSYFTSAEQGLMKDTTIYTNDTKNNSVYSTTDKLYLAYGYIDDDQYITVGTNSKDSLNNGLRIDNSYWGNSFFGSVYRTQSKTCTMCYIQETDVWTVTLPSKKRHWCLLLNWICHLSFLHLLHQQQQRRGLYQLMKHLHCDMEWIVKYQH